MKIKLSSFLENFETLGPISENDNDLLYNNGFNFHTKEDFGQYILFDLEKQQRITHITIKNRQDCCQERLIDRYIYAGNSPEEMIKIWKFDIGENDINIDFKNIYIEARYIKIGFEKDKKESLHLAKVFIETSNNIIENLSILGVILDANDVNEFNLSKIINNINDNEELLLYCKEEFIDIIKNDELIKMGKLKIFSSNKEIDKKKLYNMLYKMSLYNKLLFLFNFKKKDSIDFSQTDTNDYLIINRSNFNGF